MSSIGQFEVFYIHAFPVAFILQFADQVHGIVDPIDDPVVVQIESVARGTAPGEGGIDLTRRGPLPPLLCVLSMDNAFQLLPERAGNGHGRQEHRKAQRAQDGLPASFVHEIKG